MVRYIYQQKEWPEFTWDQEKLAPILAHLHRRLGRLLGQMQSYGFDLRSEALLRTLTLDVVKSSEIENEILDIDQVRSSIARRLGMQVGGLVPSTRHVDGTVEMMLDATQQFNKPLNRKRLLQWHCALFPTGDSGLYDIIVGKWRDDSNGPMQVISGPIGRERVHYEAPSADKLENEMTAFLTWFNENAPMDPLLKAAIAHFWFVTIHPFEDGNGRIARAIADMQLARADMSNQRFYSMSAQIKKDRNAYYAILEKSQKGTLNITSWLEWFLACLDRALDATENTLSDIIFRARFWEKHVNTKLNDRQRLMLNKLLDNFEGKLTSTKWAKIAKCSQDTALRDIQALIDLNILVKEEGGGRNTSYVLTGIRSGGQLRGSLEIRKDFDAPLSDDLLKRFNQDDK